VPIADDPSRPNGRVLLDQGGTPLAHFVQGTRDGRPLADLVETAPDAAVPAVVSAIEAELAGWKVAGDEALGRALAAAGATPTRHAHVMSRDLREHPADGDPQPPGIGPLDATAEEIAPLHRAAYPPGHPDWAYTEPGDSEDDLRAILAGEMAGPVLPCSRHVRNPDGTLAGVLIITTLDGPPPFGRPWVAELFRAPGPELRGTGRALLEAGLAAATRDGHATIGLAVSEGNPAVRLYAALGFERILSSLVVIV